MEPNRVIDRLVSKYESLIWTKYQVPSAYTGEGKIKAIILGADPTHIVNNRPIQIKSVFEINDQKSPYWRGINRNMQCVNDLTKSNVFVQNVCRNYFTRETSKNNKWLEIAREYWIPFLREDLKSMFSENIPILMTTEFILNAALIDNKKRIDAFSIYSECKSIPKEQNLFNRELFAFYRHPNYSLIKWEEYRNFISTRLNMH
jgi:hypothetical protein